MAGYLALSAVVEGLARHLRRAYELSGPDAPSCDFQALGTAEMKALKDSSATCALYLYRVTHNPLTRNQAPTAGARPLPVDLHILFSLWLSTALHEHTVLGWLLRELARYPVLDSGLLAGNGGFGPSDRLQFVPAELSLDDTARLWQLLNAPYRPSLTCIVRNVLISPEDAEELAPVVATRMAWQEHPANDASGSASGAGGPG